MRKKEREKGKRGRREGEKRGGGEKGESDSDGEGGEHKQVSLCVSISALE